MVVGYLKNVESTFNGEKKVYKQGAICFPLVPKVLITLTKNRKENLTANDPTFFINMNKDKNYPGPKSRIGALWLKKVEKQDSPKFGQDYLSGNIETPLVANGILYLSVFKVEEPKEGEQPKEWDYEILWNPPRPKQEDNSYAYQDTYIPDNYESIDENEPF